MPRPLLDRIFEKLCRVGNTFGFDLRGPATAHYAGSIEDVPATERTSSPMHRAFYENKGMVVHKWRGYLEIYDRHLSRYRDTPVRILELGVFKGGSLQMWRQYFGERATIFGIDINPDCTQYDGIGGQVRIGSQDDASFLQHVVSEMGGVDVVIDDGSHVASHQKTSFEILFPLLDARGVYICEDTHTAYWPGFYEGGYRRPSTIIETMKRLVDDLHGDFHRHPASLAGANRTIHGLHFYNSMAVIEKAPQPDPIHIQVP